MWNAKVSCYGDQGVNCYLESRETPSYKPKHDVFTMIIQNIRDTLKKTD